MTYELAKELKDAGFPQNIYFGSDYYDEEKELLRFARRDVAGGNDSPQVKVPTLSELIEVCGNGFTELERWSATEWVARGICGEYSNGAKGETAEIVVAKIFLWLALNKE